ncbi:ABC transporter substrate-binding protein [Sodalis praecaptivus]|nr:ABC transporter substrate-binding protein [Sodalis praecaptivus]
MTSVAALVLLWGAAARADDLVIGMKAAVDNADPHQLFTPNRNVDLQVYEPLIYQDRYLKPQPWLATAWKNIDPVTWELTLREGVKFSNGQPFTAEDVVFSLRRGLTLDGLRTYRGYLKDIVKVEALDAHRIRITTRQPTSLLPWNLTSIGMVSAAAAKGATAADFNGGRAAVGTGPYRWVKWTPGQEVVLAKNPDYWQGAEPWDKVTYRFIPNDSARVAALLSGDVDVIDQVPGNLSKRITANQGTALVEDTSVFNAFLAPDRYYDVSPFITANDGSPLPGNPFKNPQVRQALTLAINRDGLASRIMQGAATPTGQLAPEGMKGYDPGIALPRYDPARARQLLKDAGYPQGFRLTLHCYNDRFAGDAQTCQAVAAMLTAVGITTRVETMPSSVFFKRATSGGANGGPGFSMYMALYGTPTGNSTNFLITTVETYDKAKGLGINNRGQYANPAIDKVIDASQTTFDDAENEKLLLQATRMTLEDQAVIPLFFLKSSWGIRAGLTLEPRRDGFTMARNIRRR